MKIFDKSDKLVAEIDVLDGNKEVVDAGLWITLKTEDGTKPSLCLIKNSGHFYLGLYKDTNKSTVCDFAVTVDDSGVHLQAVKNGEVAVADLFDLIKKVI